MPASIGLRIYRAFITKDGDTKGVEFSENSTTADPYVFIHKFLSNENLKVVNDLSQRNWHVKDITYASEDNRNFFGTIRYGIYGFESDLVDTKTSEVVHNRALHHAEVIPLSFHVWSPTDANWAYICMQSFQGRSCVTVVQEVISEEFTKANEGYRLRFVKISPSDGEAKALFDHQVREIRLSKKHTPTDRADVYAGKVHLSTAKYQLSIQAQRNGTLGRLGDVKEFFNTKKNLDGTGVIEFEGDQFDEVSAEVRVGRKTRIVGVIGYNNDAGVIDITNDVVFGDDGHPTCMSVYSESNSILIDIHSVLKLKQK